MSSRGPSLPPPTPPPHHSISPSLPCPPILTHACLSHHQACRRLEKSASILGVADSVHASDGTVSLLQLATVVSLSKAVPFLDSVIALAEASIPITLSLADSSEKMSSFFFFFSKEVLKDERGVLPSAVAKALLRLLAHLAHSPEGLQVSSTPVAQDTLALILWTLSCAGSARSDYGMHKELFRIVRRFTEVHVHLVHVHLVHVHLVHVHLVHVHLVRCFNNSGIGILSLSLSLSPTLINWRHVSIWNQIYCRGSS